jgi:hypothetical protein
MADRRFPGRLKTCRSCSAGVFSPGLDVCITCLCAEIGVTYAQLDRWCRAGYGLLIKGLPEDG